MAFALLSSAQPAPRVNEDATEPRNGRHRAGARALPVLGGIAIPLTDSIEIVAEGGRLSNLNPELLDTFLAFSPLDFRLSAWYGETGVPVPRAVALRGHAVRGGDRRLRTSQAWSRRDWRDHRRSHRRRVRVSRPHGADARRGRRCDRAGGPIVLDLGYRYKKIMVDGTVQSFLGGGEALDVSQARIGVGVRF